MNMLWTVVQEGAGAETPVFNLAANVSFWTLVIFLALLAALWRFAYPPILGYAAAREKRIQEALDEARRQREQAERLLEEQRRELAEAQHQAQQLINEGKQAAEQVRQELLSRTRAEQAELVDKARRDIQQERDRAVESLRREAVDLALGAAARLVGQKVDATADRGLVIDYLQQVSGSSDSTGVA